MSSLTADGTSLVPAAGNPANGGAVVAPAPVFDGPNLPVQDGPNKPPAPVAPVTPVAPVVKAPAPTAPTTPVTPTAGQIYNNNGSVDDTTLDDTGISGGQNETSQNDMSDAETRAQTIARFQSQIDATNAIYADELAKAQVAGKNMIGEQTASNGRAGLSGSSFGNASIGGVEDKNQQNYAAVEAAKQAAIATIMDGANKQADTDVAAKNTAYNAGLDETLKYQNDKDTRTATNTSTAAKTFLDQGIDPNTIDPALQKSLATKYGVSFGSIVDSYNTQKASAAAASAAAAQKAEFKLGAGETQFDANGNPIAHLAAKGTGGAGGGSDAVSNLLGTLNDYNGQKYITSTDLEGLTPAEKSVAIAAAKAQGLKTLSPKDGDAISAINTAHQSLNDFGKFINDSGVLPKNAFGQPIQLANVSLNKYLQTNNSIQEFKDWQDSTLQVLSGLTGKSSARLYSQIKDMLPQPTDTLTTAIDNINTINKLLDNSATGYIGKAPATPKITIPNASATGSRSSALTPGSLFNFKGNTAGSQGTAAPIVTAPDGTQIQIVG